MSAGTLQLILQRLDKVDQRSSREQTRLRTDLLEQMERVLAQMQSLKDDVTVAVTFASRADAATEATGIMQRTVQSQISGLRARIERLEGKFGGTS